MEFATSWNAVNLRIDAVEKAQEVANTATAGAVLRLEGKLDKLIWWTMGLLASTLVSMILFILTIFAAVMRVKPPG